jgi:hypothetical protein
MPRIFDNIAIDLLPAFRDTLEISQSSDFRVTCLKAEVPQLCKPDQLKCGVAKGSLTSRLSDEIGGGPK